ncbi:MAG: hypothetical protein JXB26_07185 [Candidatus Aminicenantes bacterium]|nr:hypothetical protein [Candidatus Aminicenantes bacterium]
MHRYVVQRFCFLMVFLFFFCSGFSSAGEDSFDGESVDSVIKALYASISFEKGEFPDLERLRALFAPGACFVRLKEQGLDRMDASSFITSFSERIKTGEIESFYEAEVGRREHVYDRMVQIFSSYVKGANTRDREKYIRGINGIQLFFDGKGWRIASIVWEDETPGRPIPEHFLHKTGKPSRD